MYENFIFDLYGTLVDIHTNESKPSFWKKCAALFTELGCSYQPDELKKQYQYYIQVEKRRLESSYALPEVNLEFIFHSLFMDKGLKPSHALLQFYASFFRVLSRDYLAVYKDTISILDFLKKEKKNIYLLSNAQSLFTLPEMKQLSLIEYFDDILISSEVGCKKPDPQFMNTLICRHHLKIEESIMIGNEYKSDMSVAEAFQMDDYYIHTNLSPELTGIENATFMDLNTGYLSLTSIKALIL